MLFSCDTLVLVYSVFVIEIFVEVLSMERDVAKMIKEESNCQKSISKSQLILM